jgi:DNA-binding PadR family transcriptional regulator
MTRAPSPGPPPGRVLGLYALSAMDRDGRLYGYELAERIAARTEGTWHPGPGAIYPALGALVTRGLARSRVEGRRRVYRITPRGRSLLRGIRRQMLWRTRGGPDLGLLWSEIAGRDDPGQFRFERLQHQLESMSDYLARAGTSERDLGLLRASIHEVLRRIDRELQRNGPMTQRTSKRR